ncbi:MAG: tetratricopeptide repeat protein [Bacteroidales bacterium]
MKYHSDAYALAKENNNPKMQVIALNNLGVVYRRIDNHAFATEYHIKALQLAEEIRDSFGISVACNSLGNIFSLNSRYDEAIEYFTRALHISEAMNNSLGQAMNNNNIGEVYEFKGNYSKAKEFYVKSLEINTNINSVKGISINYNALGKIDLYNHNYRSAYNYFMKALAIDKKMGDKKFLADSYVNLSRVLLAMNLLNDAKDNIDLSIRIAKEIKSLTHLQWSYEVYSNYYKKQERYDSALFYYTLASNFKDSVLNEKNTRHISTIQTIYETEKKENEIKLLTQEQELKQKELKRQNILKNGLLIGLILTILIIISIYQAFITKKKTNKLLSRQIEEIETQNIRLEEQKQEIETQKEEIVRNKNFIEQKNTNLEEAYKIIENYIEKITDSIRYAERIQESIQPNVGLVKDIFADSFIYNKPKDIVSGDFYWMITSGKKVYLALSDCTGHGVPGAFMSIIGIDLLNQAVNLHHYFKPDQIIAFLNEQLIKRLRKSETEHVLKDSMDIAVCIFDKETYKLDYTGALIPLFVQSNGALNEIKPDYITLGTSFEEEQKSFTINSFKLIAGDWIYLSSDGYFDQLGGDQNKKYMRSRFRQIISQIHHLPGHEQKAVIEKEYLQWMGKNEQIDDVLVWGIKIKKFDLKFLVVKRLFLLVCILFSLQCFPEYLFSQVNGYIDSIIVNSIRSNDLSYLNEFAQRRGVDGTFLNDSHTLLTFAIDENNFLVVKYIVQKGANINLIVNNLSPLMHCAINDRSEIASYLIKFGATVDLYNTHRNTALLYGSRYGNLNTVKVLTQRRADPFLKNFIGYNSLDYAVEFHKEDVAEYLKGYMVRYAKGAFPSVIDGPYLEFLGFNRIKAFYMINDSLSGRIYLNRKTFKINDTLKFKGFIDLDTMNYEISNSPNVYQMESSFSNVKRVAAIGDIHGSYDSLRNVLINNHIIDNNNNWTFGDGHLVFIGDLFDRGDKVTEVLWLVYKLWIQAPRNGGLVHVLLGNHELLALNRDYRYANEKYIYLTRGLDIEYSDLFSPYTFLGGFVRSFKVAVNIDSVLFVHAGFSTFFVDHNISVSEVNESVYQFLGGKSLDFVTERSVSVFSDANSDKGPFWYRGYLSESKAIPRATNEDILKVLKFYDAKTMVIGHTEVQNIDTLYNGKLIPLNVPFDRVGIRKQVLLILNKKFYRCYSDGTRDLIM